MLIEIVIIYVLLIFVTSIFILQSPPAEVFARLTGKAKREKAADDDERADIASVIYNRLRADMQLGIDASILYVHQDHDGAPTAEMLKEKSPYNTRIYKGLPPTPICNPGLMSIIAALNPSQTDYYYYALDTDTGRHRFFNDENEFNAFVATQDY